MAMALVAMVKILMEIDAMKQKENLAIKGTLEILVNGKIVLLQDNLITTNGLTGLADLLASATPIGIAEIAAGSGTTAPTEGDVALETEYSRHSVFIQKLTGVDANKVLYTSQWLLGQIIGDVTEAGMFTPSIMFNRATFSPVTLTATDLLVINWTVAFINV